MNKIPTDKLLHFLISALLTFVLNCFLPISWAVGTAIVIGVLKEVVWDKLLKKGTFELEDMFANMIGIFCAALCIVI